MISAVADNFPITHWKKIIQIQYASSEPKIEVSDTVSDQDIQQAKPASLHESVGSKRPIASSSQSKPFKKQRLESIAIRDSRPLKLSSNAAQIDLRSPIYVDSLSRIPLEEGFEHAESVTRSVEHHPESCPSEDDGIPYDSEIAAFETTSSSAQKEPPHGSSHAQVDDDTDDEVQCEERVM